MKEEQLIKANEELQLRIKNLQSELLESNKRYLDTKVENSKLLAEILKLKDKVKIKEKLVRNYKEKVGSKVATKLTKDINKDILSKIDKSNKFIFSKRDKSINGILKNKSRYKLTYTEIQFLTGIKGNKRVLTEKQEKWYSDIVKRGKTEVNNNSTLNYTY